MIIKVDVIIILQLYEYYWGNKKVHNNSTTVEKQGNYITHYLQWSELAH